MIQAIAAIFAISARGQGFLNLNFGAALVGTNSPGNNGISIPVTDALPDWTAFDGDYALPDINYLTNAAYVGGTLELLGGSAALSGNDFSVHLGSNGSISQTATVPDDAGSLQFEATSPGSGMYITLGGQSLPYLALFEGTDYTVYGANIPADLDGQTETLIFGMQGIGQTLLDDINFVIVPEPSGCALMGLGAVALLVFRRLWQSGSPAGIAIYHPATVGQLPVDDCSLNG